MADLGEFGAAVRDATGAEPDTFRFYGEVFTVADRLGGMPLLRFAAVANQGTEAEDMAGLAAMNELLRDCLVEEDWPRFQKVATDNKSDAEEMMGVCGAVYRAISGRPTARPSGSADGPSPTSGSLKEVSFSDVSSLSPIERDPRLRGLQSVQEAGAELADVI